MSTIDATAGALVAWDPNSGQLPAHLANALDEFGSNIPDRNTTPSLSYEGKTWTIVKDGNKTKLQSRNSDGDMLPIAVMRVVVLKFNADRGRAYYEGTYNPAAASAPKCWSPDGVKPDASVKEKQASACQGCPMSVKGSKIGDGGREQVACASHRMLALVPGNDLEFDPLRLKIAVTSDYDKEVTEHGWFAWRQYVDWLKARGVSHTAVVVTKIKFDPNVAYPKLLFSLDRPLSVEEIEKVKAALANPKVDELLAEKWTPAGTNGTPIDESDIKPHGLEGAYADGWQAHPEAAGYSWKGTEVLTNDDLAARYPAPTPPPVTQQAPAVPASEMVIEQAPAAPTPPAAPAAPVVEQAVWKPIEEAEKDGWVKHPEAADYHYRGQEVVLSADLLARYPAPAAIVAPAAPPAPPAPPPAPRKTPRELALEAGWVQHPDSEPHGYLGSEVLTWPEIEARFAGNVSASTATPAAVGGSTSAATAEAQGGSTTTTTATTAASPSDGAMPAEVQDLLNKWA